jgi:hypothetical protein
MTNIQFSNQENLMNFQDNFRDQVKPATQAQTGTGRKLKLIPVALIFVVIFVGVVIFAKIQTEKRLAQLDTDQTLVTTNISGNLIRENDIQPQDQATNAAIPSATPSAQMRLTGEAQVVPTPTPVPTPIPTPRTIATPVPTATPVPAVVLPTNPTPTPTPSNSGGSQVVVLPREGSSQTTTQTRTVVVQEDNTYKPSTPYLETCGDFRDDRWQDLKVVLPKFENGGRAAVEYWVQVGKNNGNNDVRDQRFSQTDQVVFGGTYDNNQEYFVRFAIRMDGGEWQKWSNTLRFKCERKVI